MKKRIINNNISRNKNSFFAEEKTFNKRIYLVYFSFLFILLGLIYRLYQIQIVNHQQFAEAAENSRMTTRVLPPKRGTIYFQDKNGTLIPVATNRPCYLLYLNPKEIENPQAITDALYSNLQGLKDFSLPKEEIFQRASKINDPYEPIAKNIEDEKLIQKIKDLNLKGVYFEERSCRYYPFQSLASQTIGFVSETEDGKLQGQYGLEAYYDKILSGEEGVFIGPKDAVGRLIRSLLSKEKELKDGSDVVVSIDKNVQEAAEKAAEGLVKGREAESSSIVIMEVPSGKIIALANYPSFNLNEYQKIKDYSLFLNPVTQERYEPGSVVKPITMAAGLDSGKVTPETTYVDKGYYEVGGYRIVNYNNEVNGEVNMYKVLERSINTGAIFVANQLGNNLLRTYFKNFGFTEPTGIDLPNEIVGDLSNLEYPKVNPTYFATASYGVGISLTPIRLVTAYATIANEGKSINPYLAEKIITPDGQEIPISSTSENIQMIKKETADILIKMLQSVIDNGFGGNAKVKGYSLAGKTGTSFIYGSHGGYTDEENHTFMGIFPASKPRFIALVRIEKPHNNPGAASYTVTLGFREIEQFLINYYNLPPDEIQE